MLYFAFVFPHLLYGIEIYGNTYQSHLSKLVKLKNKILRILQNAPLKSLTLSLYKNYNPLGNLNFGRQPGERSSLQA